MSNLYISDALPGVGGTLKQTPEDFQVWEVPAYEPSGAGNHRYFELTKRECTTRVVVDELARRLGIGPGDIGVAGLKDRRAVTTQRISVPAEVLAAQEALEAISSVVSCREVGVHDNKLRRGHLRGNRFEVRVTDVAADSLVRARAVADQLNRTGWPNFFGDQRFGQQGDNAQAGREAVQTGRLRGPRWKRSLLLSAYQSELYNRYLERRIRDGTFGCVVDGDLCAKLPAGGMFLMEDPANEQARMQAFEISPTGPMFGFKMRRPNGAAWEMEQRILNEESLELADFRRTRLPGSRRRIRLPLTEFELEFDGEALVFRFFLPAGSYATVLLGEFMKSHEAAEDFRSRSQWPWT